MQNELWEVVRPHDLKVGDTIIPLGEAGIDEAVVERIDEHGNAWYEQGDFSGCVLGSQGHALRRYSGPSPEVLMRALKMAEKNSVVEDSFGRQCQSPLAEDYIRLAEAELAAETKGGAK
jgi:hypothetical protein